MSAAPALISWLIAGYGAHCLLHLLQDHPSRVNTLSENFVAKYKFLTKLSQLFQLVNIYRTLIFIVASTPPEVHPASARICANLHL